MMQMSPGLKTARLHIAADCINGIMSAKTTPSDFLKNIIGRPVLVKLNSGVDYMGMLRAGGKRTHRKRVDDFNAVQMHSTLPTLS